MCMKKEFIDISTEEKKIEVYNLFNSFNKIGDIYKYYRRSGNSREIKYIRYIAKQINFDLNIYKERKINKNFCLQCGKELNNKQVKFCGRSCSAIFNNKLRDPMSEETRIKISQTLKNKYGKNDSLKTKDKPKRKCLICGNELKGRKISYCSKTCSQQRNALFYKNNGIIKKCEYCGKEFIGKGERKFCSNNCSTLFRNEKLLSNFINGHYINNGNSKLPKVLRDFLYKKNNYKCQLCNYEGYNIKTGNSILQIHHIDGNTKNNTPENLQVICPNCHAKTENYMALNKGKSSRDRRYKNKEDKSNEC